jgi:hypothetical protein
MPSLGPGQAPIPLDSSVHTGSGTLGSLHSKPSHPLAQSGPSTLLPEPGLITSSRECLAPKKSPGKGQEARVTSACLGFTAAPPPSQTSTKGLLQWGLFGQRQ